MVRTHLSVSHASMASGLGFFLVVASLPSALADNVVNDVVAGGSDTITLGGSTDISYKVVATGGDGQPGCNAGDGSSALVTILVPAAVVASPGSLTFTSCGTSQDVTFSASAVGDYAVGVSVADAGTGTYHVVPAAFTLHVLAPPDATPPVITPILVPPAPDGLAGWYVGDVGLSWLVSDPESAIVSTSGCGPEIIVTDTVIRTITCEATSAGGTASAYVEIRRDATAPLIVAVVSSPPDASGWYNGATGAPTVTFLCDDATSGVFECPPPALLGEGAGQVVSGTAVDVAGNSASADSPPLGVDLAPPGAEVGLSCALAGDAGWCRGPVTVTPTASDGLSGLGSTACRLDGVPVDCIPTLVSAEGSHLFELLASDVAGNDATASAEFLIDTVAPTSSAILDGTEGLPGWYRSSVEVTLGCEDAVSGCSATTYSLDGGDNATYAGPFVVSDEGSHVVKFWSRDVAGNEEPDPSVDFTIDHTPPLLAVTDVAAFATNATGGTVGYSVNVTDNLDPAPDVECLPASGSFFPLGTTTVVCAAVDAAGNEALAEFNVTVRFNVQGFFNPVKNHRLNTVKAGSTVPLKFAIRTPGGGYIGDLSVIESFQSVAVGCDTPLPTSPVAFTTTGGTSLRYDAVANQFVQNWQTPKEKGCVMTSVAFTDGTVLSALFRLF